MRLKDAVFRAAKAAGAFSLVRDSAWRRERLLILCYHGVSQDDEHEWDPQLYVSQDQLRRRLRALRDGGYTILPLDEATHRLYDGTLPPRSVALTFDDGAVDFERRALPVLREFNAPATLYLTTFYVNTRLPVFDTMLTYVLWKGRASHADLAPVIASPTPLRVDDDAARGATRRALYDHAIARKMSAEEKDALIADCAARLGVDYAAIRKRELLGIMSPEAVRALPRDLIDVQLHTHRHRTPRVHAPFVREIADNIAEIQLLRGRGDELTHFCYPSGEYFGEFLGWLRECGVKYATTCVPDIATRDAEPLLLPRLVDTMHHSDIAFEAWASGFAALMPKRRRFRADASRLAPLPAPDSPDALANAG